jgi:hypothetical protein
MNISSNSILIIGYSLTGLLFLMGLGKKLRNDNIIKISLIVSLIVAVIGFLIRSEQTKMAAGNAADSFYSPLVYIATYAGLRYLYKRRYRVEPTYNRSSWHDYKEGRRQNWLDVTVHLLPFMLALVIPMLSK